jgi:rod shape determining protein RodA
MFEPTLNESPPRPDRLLLASMLGLMFFGVAFVYSASMVDEPVGLWQQYQESSFREFCRWLLGELFFRQIIWYVLGLGAAAVVCLVDYRSLARWAMLAYWGNIGLLVAVLLPFIGSVRFGARRWINLGFFQFQPSEFAKLAFILAMAHFLSRPADELRKPNMFWKAAGLLALPFLLVMKEPDLGSALVLVPVWVATLLVSGVPHRFLVRLTAVVGIAAALFLVDVLFAPPGWQIKLQDYQRRRLLVYFDRDYTSLAPPGASKAQIEKLADQQRQDSYNVRQALISVGSGGVTGKGWRQGTQNALGYLPRAVAHNDFIFSVIAEESGFVGSLMVLTLYGVVLFVGIRIASQARDRLGRLVAVGVVALLFSHVFINIGMNIRLMPVTGVPLPLLSYGGSSVLVSLIAMGLLHSVHIYRRTY